MPHGIHHITAIAGNPQTNLGFYSGLLGLRFIKKTINFDDPGTYHFYFGDSFGNFTEELFRNSGAIVRKTIYPGSIHSIMEDEINELNDIVINLKTA